MFQAEESGVHGVNNKSSRRGRRLRGPQREVAAPGAHSHSLGLLLAGLWQRGPGPSCCHVRAPRAASPTGGKGGGGLAAPTLRPAAPPPAAPRVPDPRALAESCSRAAALPRPPRRARCRHCSLQPPTERSCSGSRAPSRRPQRT